MNPHPQCLFEGYLWYDIITWTVSPGFISIFYGKLLPSTILFSLINWSQVCWYRLFKLFILFSTYMKRINFIVIYIPCIHILFILFWSSWRNAASSKQTSSCRHEKSTYLWNRRFEKVNIKGMLTLCIRNTLSPRTRLLVQVPCVCLCITAHHQRIFDMHIWHHRYQSYGPWIMSNDFRHFAMDSPPQFVKSRILKIYYMV